MKKKFLIIVSIIIMIALVSCEKEIMNIPPNGDILTEIASLPYPNISPDDIDNGMKNGETGGLKSSPTTVQLMAFDDFVVIDNASYIRRFAYYIIKKGIITNRGYVFQAFDLIEAQNGNFSNFVMNYQIGFSSYDGYSLSLQVYTSFSIANIAKLFFTHPENSIMEGCLMYNTGYVYCFGGPLMYVELIPPIGAFKLLMQVGGGESDGGYYITTEFNTTSFSVGTSNIVFMDVAIESNIQYRFRFENEPTADIVKIQIEYNNGDVDELTMDATNWLGLIDLAFYIEEIQMEWYSIDNYGQLTFMANHEVEDQDIVAYGIDPNGVILLEED